MAAPTLDDIAAALYAGPPEEFTTARNARAKDLDDRALAAEVKALRKPAVAAWVVNVFAQQGAAQLGEALALAAELREAQADLDAAALAKLGRERRALTRRLAETAADLAGSRGERVTAATRDAVEQTISAAFFDPDAAAAVASGRLVRALEPSGTADDIRDAVAGTLPALQPQPPRPPDELQERRKRRDAERQLAVAEKDLAAAERALAKEDEVMQALSDRAEELADGIAELEAQIEKLHQEADRVERDRPAAEERRTAAVEKKDAAAEAVQAARAALADL
ncbi:transposase [Microbacterium sp. str. 'China']|uniref:transposase n=1 Tax=Microbacterium sp. str. 'China' TaxID=2103230 RepID=UPI000D0176E7|nr:transposase [Microbacterium sp. str. 'China']AVL96098.1 transposase [Microbacterium sp. str. 'China']